MTQEELNKVVENHNHWLNEDCNGWENMKADLRRANLSEANLIEANLREANLSEANLRDADLGGANLILANLRDAELRRANLMQADILRADLRGVDLKNANLRRADLRGVDLKNANLRRANLSEANLRDADLGGANLILANLIDANLRRANLSEANLIDADLGGANLSEANLRDADLGGANLRGANLRDSDLTNVKNLNIPLVCPTTGSFIGYKKAIIVDADNDSKTEYVIDVIVELEIPEDAKRSSATTNKCRCSKAKVLSITSIDGSESYNTAKSVIYNFHYYVGEIVEVEDFDDNRFNECSTGIHFFMTREEAENYNYN